MFPKSLSSRWILDVSLAFHINMLQYHLQDESLLLIVTSDQDSANIVSNVVINFPPEISLRSDTEYLSQARLPSSRGRQDASFKNWSSESINIITEPSSFPSKRQSARPRTWNWADSSCGCLDYTFTVRILARIGTHGETHWFVVSYSRLTL